MQGLVTTGKGVGNACFQTVHALIGINRKERSRRSSFQGIQPGMILMIAPHKNQGALGHAEQRSHPWARSRKMVSEAEHGGIGLAMASGSAIQTLPIRKGGQIACLQDQVNRLSRLLLPACAQRETEQETPVNVGKERNRHDLPQPDM